MFKLARYFRLTSVAHYLIVDPYKPRSFTILVLERRCHSHAHRARRRAHARPSRTGSGARRHLQRREDLIARIPNIPGLRTACAISSDRLGRRMLSIPAGFLHTVGAEICFAGGLSMRLRRISGGFGDSAPLNSAAESDSAVVSIAVHGVKCGATGRPRRDLQAIQ